MKLVATSIVALFASVAFATGTTPTPAANTAAPTATGTAPTATTTKETKTTTAKTKTATTTKEDCTKLTGAAATKCWEKDAAAKGTTTH